MVFVLIIGHVCSVLAVGYGFACLWELESFWVTCYTMNNFFFFLEQFILLRIFFWVFKCELKWSLKPLLIANLWWKAAYDQLTQTRAWYLNLVECGVNYFSAIDSVFFLFIIFFIYLFIFCLKNIFIFLCKLVFSNTYLHLRMLDSALVVELKDHHVARMLLNVT